MNDDLGWTARRFRLTGAALTAPVAGVAGCNFRKQSQTGQSQLALDVVGRLHTSVQHCPGNAENDAEDDAGDESAYDVEDGVRSDGAARDQRVVDHPDV